MRRVVSLAVVSATLFAVYLSLADLLIATTLIAFVVGVLLLVRHESRPSLAGVSSGPSGLWYVLGAPVAGILAFVNLIVMLPGIRVAVGRRSITDAQALVEGSLFAIALAMVVAIYRRHTIGPTLDPVETPVMVFCFIAAELVTIYCGIQLARRLGYRWRDRS